MIEEKEDITEREKALDDVQRMIESVLRARAKDNYSDEELPMPPNPPNRLAPRSGKRTAISCEYRFFFSFNYLLIIMPRRLDESPSYEL